MNDGTIKKAYSIDEVKSYLEGCLDYLRYQMKDREELLRLLQDIPVNTATLRAIELMQKLGIHLQKP